jgi:nicotinate (nicotinamide) nucleotide adenylyltransferase
METERLKEIINRVSQAREPQIEFIKREPLGATRLGIFAASFNPITNAHVELMQRAAISFALDEMLALAGSANADKASYECALTDRLAMLALTFADDPRTSIGLSSHAFYADMIEPLARLYSQSELHFVIGFDTFERVLDRENRYTQKYHRRYRDRAEALDYLFTHSRLIVAGRAGAGRDEVRASLADQPARFAGRVAYLDTPDDIGERSATEVRLAIRAGKPIGGLVPSAVERYIETRKLYR